METICVWNSCMDIISMKFMYEYYKYETYMYGNSSLSMFGLGKP